MSTNFANRLFVRAPWRAIAAECNGVHSSLAQTRTVVCRSSALAPPPASALSTSIRSFSYDAGKGGSRKMNPSYQVYGEESALTIKAMMPGFKALGSSSMVLDNRRRGRILLEWTPRNADGRFSWDTPIRFALSPEEAGLLIAKIPKLQTSEFVRKASSESSQFSDIAMESAEKVFRAIPKEDGSVLFTVDFETNGMGGQEPPTSKEATGPLEIILMAGEYQVVKSIIEYSIPRLVGWSTMLDSAMEEAIDRASKQDNGPYNNQGGSGGGVPF